MTLYREPDTPAGVTRTTTASPVAGQPVQLVLEGGVGGVSLAQVRAEIQAHLSTGGAIHVGEGPPPALIVGAKVGDVYIDVPAGTLYELTTGA